MVDIITEIQAKMVIKQIEIDSAARSKMEEFTRIRLGVAPGAPVTSKQIAETGTAMQKIGMGGGDAIAALTTGILGLVTAITSVAGILGMMIENSKIIQLVMSTIGKALGLIMDLILMPFIPALTFILMKLFLAIMQLNDWYRKWFASGGITLPGDQPMEKYTEESEKKRLEQIEGFWTWWNTGLANIRKWIDENITTPFWNAIDSLKLKWNEFTLFASMWIDENITKKFWGFVEKAGTWIDENITQKFWGLVDSATKWIQLYIYEPFHFVMWQIDQWVTLYIRDPFNAILTQIRTWIDTNIKTPFNNFVSGIEGLFKEAIDKIRDWLLSLPLVKQVSTVANSFGGTSPGGGLGYALPGGPGDEGAAWGKGGWGTIPGTLALPTSTIPAAGVISSSEAASQNFGLPPPFISYLDSGGLIKETGMAMVHKGELVIPRDQTEKIFKTVLQSETKNTFNSNILGKTENILENLPKAASGGSVEKTGAAVIHKGETILPVGQSGIVVNIYGTYQNDDDLYRKFIDRLRTDQWRRNV